MITVLVVSAARPDVEALEARHPAVEVLLARDAEDALEKLGRNRRIDAVLLLGAEPGATASEILSDNPAAPPLYAPAATEEAAARVRGLPPGTPSELIDRISSDLRAT